MRCTLAGIMLTISLNTFHPADTKNILRRAKRGLTLPDLILSISYRSCNDAMYPRSQDFRPYGILPEVAQPFACFNSWMYKSLFLLITIGNATFITKVIFENLPLFLPKGKSKISRLRNVRKYILSNIYILNELEFWLMFELKICL